MSISRGTTVDTIFREEEFSAYVKAFKASLANGSADGMMGVTDYIDDEKPLYIAPSPVPPRGEAGRRMGFPLIENFLDEDKERKCPYISAGIYGLTPKGLIAFPFSKVLDIDHAGDIEKAERMVASPPALPRREGAGRRRDC